MTLEELVDERHEMRFHDIGNLVLVMINDRHVALNHLD